MPSFTTVRFGKLDYREADVFHLPDGLLGMPALNRWLLLVTSEEAPLKWFQSLDRADFGFPVIEPCFYRDDYAVDVPREVLSRVGAGSAADMATLIITTVHAGGEEITGNLVAPLVVDPVSRRGAQLVLDAEKHSLRQDIDYVKFGLAVPSESSDNIPESGVVEAAVPAETRETVRA